jgi:hypothetical protein
MAFALTWKIEFGDINGLTDITSYVQQMNLDLSAEIATCGRGSAQLTINNNGGQFTPTSGTYGSIDWFSKAMIITATSGANTGIVFAGMIIDYHITMVNSKESTVTINCLDAFSLGGKSFARAPTNPDLGLNIETAIERTFNGVGFANFQVIQTPTLGQSISYFSKVEVTNATGSGTSIDPQAINAGFVGDWLNNQIIPCGPAALIPTDYVITTYATVPNVWIWNATLIDRQLNRTSPTLYEFADGSSAITTGQIPFSDISTGFRVEDLTNEAVISRVAASVPSATNDASQQLYGPRTRSYTNLAAGSLSTYRSDIANFWVNRYGSIQYLPMEIQTSYAVLKGSAVDDGVAMLEFMQLLWPSTALWNRLTIKYKPTGATSTQTIEMIATRRLITADPSNTTIRLTVKSGADNQSFELDSSTYGILDTNRLA